MELSLYDILSNALWALISSYTYFVLIFSFSWNKRRYRQKSFTVIYLILCFMIGFSRRFALLDHSTIIPMISSLEPIFILLDLLLLWIFFDTEIWKSFLLVFFYSAGYPLCYFAVNAVFAFMTNMTLDSGFPFHARYMHEMSLIAVAVLTFYIVVLLFGIIRRAKSPPPVSKRLIVGILLPSVLYILGYFLIFPYMIGIENNNFPFIIGSIMFAVNVATWLSYIDLDRKNVTLYYLNRHYEDQQLYFSKIKESHRGIQKRAHDERKHYAHIMGLLRLEEYDRLESYLSSLSSGIPEFGNLLITGNQDIDTVLNAKIAEAKTENCNIIISGDLPSHLELDPVDCCILIGNCLDNAIHACRKTDDHDIKVAFSYYSPILFIQVQNKCISKQKHYFPEFSSLYKKGKQTGSGMGLEIMTSVAKKYNGDLKAMRKKDVFTVEIFLQSPSSYQNHVRGDFVEEEP